jgi:hypothetical protein
MSKEYTIEECALAVAIYGSEHFTLLSDQSKEINLVYLHRARLCLEWLGTIDYNLVRVDKMEVSDGD